MYKIDEIQSLISIEIHKEIERINSTEPKNLYEPIAYALSMGGKRLRPAMVLLGCNLFSDNIEKAYPAAIAVEVFHNFTLLHDDIMDRAEMRRNTLSVYKKYNENIAILSGDAMSILAYQYLLKNNSPESAQMLQLFSRTALEVCEGQQLDMDFENTMDVSIAQYLKMIELKTAVLLACSLKLGAMSSNAPEESANLLYSFGLNLGIAFQLQDDLLDVYADQNTFGKKIGGDIVSNKKTFLLLKALELSDNQTKSQLQDWITRKEFNETEKINAIKSAYKKLGIKEITEDCINNYYQAAIQICEKIALPMETKTELINLAQMIMDRDH
jgi:geranylgeranyl diphosphate synthase type II